LKNISETFNEILEKEKKETGKKPRNKQSPPACPAAASRPDFLSSSPCFTLEKVDRSKIERENRRRETEEERQKKRDRRTETEQERERKRTR